MAIKKLWFLAVVFFFIGKVGLLVVVLMRFLNKSLTAKFRSCARSMWLLSR